LDAFCTAMNFALSILPGFRSDIHWEAVEGKAWVRGTWEESAGREVFWKWEAALELKPLLGVTSSNCRILWWALSTIPATRGFALEIDAIARRLGLRVEALTMDVAGAINLSAHWARRSIDDAGPDNPEFTNEGSGFTGGIVITFGVETSGRSAGSL